MWSRSYAHPGGTEVLENFQLIFNFSCYALVSTSVTRESDPLN